MSLKEVARRAGMALVTVDRVLNERGGVAPDTVQSTAGSKGSLPEAHPA